MNKQNNIKLLALDMDGTTYSWGAGIVKENIAPIKAAKKAGINVSIITGRPLFAPQNKFEENGIVSKNTDSFIVAYNGALIYNFANDEIISQKYIDPKLTKQLFHLADKYNVKLKAYANDLKTVYTNKSKLVSSDLLFGGKYKKIHPWNRIKALKIFAENINDDFVNDIRNLNLNCAIVADCDEAEITAQGADKGTALSTLKHLLGLEQDNVMVIGDGENDLPMFHESGTRVAIKNSDPRLKNMADIVIDKTNEEAAVAYAIWNYLLNNPAEQINY